MERHEIIGTLFLLRKSRKDGESVPQIVAKDLPFRFRFGDKEYLIEATRKGGLIMKNA